MKHPLFAILLLAPALCGCLAKTALDVATLPVRAAGKAVERATTSQPEADAERGRELRQRDEKLGRLERRYQSKRAACESGDADACNEAGETLAAIAELRASSAGDE